MLQVHVLLYEIQVGLTFLLCKINLDTLSMNLRAAFLRQQHNIMSALTDME